MVLGLGSNLGSSREILNSAINRLETILLAVRVSSLYRTEPRDLETQPQFLNCAVAGFWDGTLLQLLDICLSVEAEHGRDRQNQVQKGPRLLDIDILWVEDVVLDSQRLSLPHPRLTERAFALTPLIDLAPNAADPHTGRSYASYLENLPAQGIYSESW